MKLNVIQRGTHILPVSHWNNDVPSPCECVAETLAQLQWQIGELIRSGGRDSKEESRTHESVEMLANALRAATRQNWKLDLEKETNTGTNRVICKECGNEVDSGEAMNGYCDKCVDKFIAQNDPEPKA